MKNFIEVVLIEGERALINVRDISLVKETSGEEEPEFYHLQIDGEKRYTFIRVAGEDERLACCHDYDTVLKKMSDAQENDR